MDLDEWEDAPDGGNESPDQAVGRDSDYSLMTGVTKVRRVSRKTASGTDRLLMPNLRSQLKKKKKSPTLISYLDELFEMLKYCEWPAP